MIMNISILRKYNNLFLLVSIFFVILFWIASLSLSKQTQAQSKQENLPSSFTKEDSTRCLEELVQNIDTILEDALTSKTKYSVMVYSLDRSQIIYSRNPNIFLTPASLTKIITTYTAFSELGADYKIQTCIYTDAPEIQNGIVEGNIYIVGYGDALFTSCDLDTLVKNIMKQGIKTIKGNIYGDGSFFDGKYNRLEYSGDEDLVEVTPPISALAIDNNTATLIVKGISNIQIFPLSYTLQPISKLQTRTGINKKQKILPIKNKREKKAEFYQNRYVPDNKNKKYTKANFSLYAGDVPLPPKKKRGTSINISTSLNEKGIQLFHISGFLSKGSTFTYFYPLLKPEMAVAGALKYKLIANGIDVKGEVAEPKKSLLSEYKNYIKLAVLERPLTEVIYLLMKNSNNYLAESIFKLIGAKLGLTDDNARSARLAIIRALTKAGIIGSPVVLNDGSGLSRRNQVNTSTLLSLLVNATKLNFAQKFDSSLSVSGLDGTLKSRMKGTLAEFNIHAKTGTLNNVSGLAGYVYTLDGERLAFVMLFNGPYVTSYKEIENRIGQLLAQFFYYHFEN